MTKVNINKNRILIGCLVGWKYKNPNMNFAEYLLSKVGRLIIQRIIIFSDEMNMKEFFSKISIESNQTFWDVSFPGLLIDPKKLMTWKITSFFVFTSLFFRNLGANQIETLEPGCFSGLNYLQELSLQRNKIRTIPKDLFLPLKNLERL